MKRAILIHRRDFAAISVLIVLAFVISGYILSHQPAFTFGHSYYTVRAQFANATAVEAGQGQAVAIAGVQIGEIGGVALKDGRAVVTMNIDRKYAPIYENATVLLRPRTPLKDMYLSLDPGTKTAGAVPDGGMLGVASTQPDIDFDQILASLDADTRTYLLLLLSGGAQAFKDPGNTGEAPSAAAVADLRATLKRFAPLARDTRTFATLLATRQANISRAIHNLNLVTNSLGGVDTELESLITSANTNFSAIASQDANLERTLTLLPGTLTQTNQTLGQVRTFAGATGPALRSLTPFAHALAPALAASQPLFADTTASIRDQLRPFSVAVQPVARTLQPAAAALQKAVPPLNSSIGVLNTLVNTLAFQPPGSEQGYLYWGSWLSHVANSLTSTQDAQGPIVRGIFMGTQQDISSLRATIQCSVPAIGRLLALLNEPPFGQSCNGAGQ